MKMQKASNLLYKKHIPILPRIIFLTTRLLCGCSIPPSVEIGKNTRFAHNGLGVIVHDKCTIGHDTVIQANVVIGGKGGKAPVIGNYCYIGAGAVLLGDINIGDDAIIGANAVVTHSVPQGMIALGVPARCEKKVDSSLIGIEKH
jgi:serine O-acetyltransferase